MVKSNLLPNDNFAGPSIHNGRLVGRERQLRELEVRYHEQCRGQQESDERPPDLLLVTGQSGTGKRALARSLERFVNRDGGYFLTGRCDPKLRCRPQHLQTDQLPSEKSTPAISYAPFVEAFSHFVEQVVDRGEETIQRVRDALVEDESECELLIDMIPAFHKILEPASQTNSLEEDGHQITIGRRRRRDRTNPQVSQVADPNVAALKKFLMAVCYDSSNTESRHLRCRLVLMLDSIQWIDESSLSLLRVLVSDRDLRPGLTLVATCRGNEVSVDDPLAVMLRELEELSGVRIVDIPVLNLTEQEVNQLVAEILDISEEDSKSLSCLLYHQTEGNPLVVKRLLHALYEKNLIHTEYLDADTMDKKDGNHQRNFQWDMEGIKVALQKLDPTDIDMLSSRIRQVVDESDTVQDVLQIVSCMGSEFLASHVDLVMSVGTKRNQTLSVLEMLETKRLIFTSNWGEKCSIYRWAHERVHEAAYNLIPLSERDKLHKAIGLTLLRNLNQSDLDESVFLVADQLVNIDTDLLERDEKEEVSTLCEMAGTKLAQSAAFERAGFYFNHGIKLLEEHSWSKRYSLKLSLYNAAAEMACCNGDHHKVDLIVGHVFDHASRCFEDTLRAYETQIYSLCARQELVEAIKVGLYVLTRLGEPFQLKDVSSRRISREIQECRRLLQGKKDRDILNLKPLRDWKKVYAIRIIQLLFPPIFQSQPHLCPLFAARVIKLTFEHGMTSMSCAGFAVLGTILCYPMYGAYVDGNRSARLGLEIMERFEAVEMKCRILCYMNAFCTPYVRPIRDCLSSLEEGAEAGLLTGDIEMSCFNNCLVCVGSLFAGCQLGWVLRLLEKHQQNFIELKNDKHAESLSILMQTILNLLGKARDPFMLKGDACDEEQLMRNYQAKGHLKAIQGLQLLKCFLAIYFNDYDRAHEMSLKIQKCKKTGLNAISMIQLIFLDAMSSLTVHQKSTWKARHAGNDSLKQLREYAEHCPENVLNKVYLVEAEQFSLRKQRDKAVRRFNMSIQLASQNNITHEEALANERAGRRLLEWGWKSMALKHLEEAKRLYEAWGSTYKMEQISELVLQVSGETESSDEEGAPQ